MPRSRPDPDALLCERCGYALDGVTEAAGPCPECGRAMRDSDPARRIGSPFQRRPGPGTLAATWWAGLRRPSAQFAVLALHPRRDRALTLLTLLAAGVVAAPVFVALSGALTAWLYALGARSDGPWGKIVGFAAVPMGLAMLLVLTRIERAGIAFFGPRRGWRITPGIARAICAHAAVGWLVGAALALAGLGLGRGLQVLALRRSIGVLKDPFLLSPYWLGAAGLLAGMLLFETLVYAGMLRCRHANMPGETAPAGAEGRSYDARP